MNRRKFNKADIIKETIRLFHLTADQCAEVKLWLDTYYHLHWTEDDSPETEFKQRRSFPMGVKLCMTYKCSA